MGRIWIILLFYSGLLLSALALSPPRRIRFIVVAGKKVIGKFVFLQQAKNALNAYQPGVTRPIRMIAEVKNGRVDRDPRFVGGQEQAAGLINGFNIWWNTWDDIDSMLNTAQSSLGDIKGNFLLVTRKEVIKEFSSLKEAKEMLRRKFPRYSRTPSRMIAEVRNGVVDDDPRVVGGQSQELGFSAGFNKYWTGWDDIDVMLLIAQEYIDRPRGDAEGVFIVVAERRVKGKFSFLSQAQRELNKYHKLDRPPSRMICEVKNGRVLDDPRTIAGRDQERGLSAGFNRYWRDWEDIDDMLWIAEEYLRIPKGEVYGVFIVVVGKRVIGKFKKLSQAKKELNRYPKGNRPPVRCILEVKNGKVLDDPRYISGRPQLNGLLAGFNNYWTGWEDIDDMIYAAEEYFLNLNNPKGIFIVVAGNRAVGKFSDLNSAKNALKAYHANDVRPSRIIIEVKNGKVLNDPRFIAGQNQEAGVSAGFNSKWNGWPDIDRMLDIAQRYLDGPPRILFIVIVDLRAIGHYIVLRDAKRALLKYPRDSRLSRCIFQALNGVLNPDISEVGGERQIDKWNSGFNSYWRNAYDVRRMLNIAYVYIVKIYPAVKPLPSYNPPPSPTPSSSPRPSDKLGDFLVIADYKVIGRYKLLSKAKKALNRYPRGHPVPSRCIFEIIRGKISVNINIIAGERQIDGLKAGFNKWWWGPEDIRKLLSAAKNHIAPPPVRGTFIVIALPRAVGKYTLLSAAKAVLRRYRPGARTPIRAVFEVRNGKCDDYPYIVGGQRQGDGLSAGFNKYWNGRADIAKMLKVCDNYIAPPTVRGNFVVIAFPRAIGKYKILSTAKEALRLFASGTKTPSRAVFEVKNGKCRPDPHVVGGERQGDGLSAGFNKWWYDWYDINRMLKVCNKFISPTPVVRGKFVVVAYPRALGKYDLLSAAKDTLKRFPSGAKAPSRAVFEVKNGKCQPDPHVVGGERQGNGLSAGFNKWWYDWTDINRMLRVCAIYIGNSGIVKPTPSSRPIPEVIGKFVVVAAPRAIGKFTRLSAAKSALNRYIEGANEPSRAVFEVKNGKCLPDPRIVGRQRQVDGISAGFNRWWWDWVDINRMLRICSLYIGNNIQTPPPRRPSHPPRRPSPPPRPKHYFLVVNSNGDARHKRGYRVLGRFMTWQSAQKRLNGLSNSRAVIEVKGRIAQRDPHKIDGQNQGGGSRVGWNKWWWDWWDINNMVSTAQSWVNRNG